MTNAVQEMPTHSGCNINKVTWKQESSARPRRIRNSPPIRGLLMSEARSSPARKLTDSGRLGPRPSSRKADLQPRPPVRSPETQSAQISELPQNVEPRNVIRSRARRRRDWEASPFLSVNTVSPDKVVIDGAPEQTSAASSNSHRRSARPVQKERKLSSRNQSSQLRSRTPKLASRCSSRATPFDYYSFYTHKSTRSGRQHGGNHGNWMHQNPSFITGPPNLWSMGNKFWPSTGRPLERNLRVVPSVTAIESSSFCPNQQVQHPFKHADSSEPLPERCPAPDLELKMQTASAICLVSKSLAAERDVPTSKQRGRLLKARLKPLHAFTPVGPRVDQCAGVQPEKKPQSPSQLQLQMRKKQLLDMLPPGILQQRPETRESMHRTSVVSDLSEDRQHDFDGLGFQSEVNDTWSDPCNVLPNNVTNVDHDYNMLLDQINIPTDPEMEENLMQYMSIHSPNKKTLSKLLDGSAGDSMACFSAVLIDGAAGMIDSALTRGKNRRKPFEDKVTFTTQKSILKTSKATAENIFSGLVWNGNSLERVQTAPEQGTQNFYGDETFDVDAERPVTAPDQPNILEAVAKQHLEKLLKEEEDGEPVQENDVGDRQKKQNKPIVRTLDPVIYRDETAGASKNEETSMLIIEEDPINDLEDITGNLILNETETSNHSEQLQITNNTPIIEITVNLGNTVNSPSLKVCQDRTSNQDLNENHISAEHITSNSKAASQSNGNNTESLKCYDITSDFEPSDMVLSKEQERDTNANLINGEKQENICTEELNRGINLDIKDSKNSSMNNNNTVEYNVDNKEIEDLNSVEDSNDADTQSGFPNIEWSKDMKLADENHQSNSVDDLHDCSTEEKNHVANYDAKERNISNYVNEDGRKMLVESKQTLDPQEGGDRNGYMSEVLPVETCEQLIDKNSINNDDATKFTVANDHQKCGDVKESFKNLPKTVQFAIPETPSDVSETCSNSEVNVPDANEAIEERAMSQVHKLPNDTDTRSQWMFLTEDECSKSKTSSIPNNVESADLRAKDYELKESPTLSDANGNNVIKRARSSTVDGEDEDESKEEEDADVELSADLCAKDFVTPSDTNANPVIKKACSSKVDGDEEDEEEENEDAADDIDKNETNEDDRNDDSGSGSAGGSAPQRPVEENPDDQTHDDQNNNGTCDSNSEPNSGTREGNSLSRAVNIDNTSKLVSNQFTLSEMSDDFDYNDIPEMDESVLFCGICGLDEDTCVCPSSKIGGSRYQSCTRIDSGYTGSITSRSFQSLPEVMEPAKECWSPREDLQLTDQANDLVMMYRNRYDDKITDEDTTAIFSEMSVGPQANDNVKRFLVKGQIINQTDQHATPACGDDTRPVNEDVSADTDGEEENSDKTVINQDVLVNNQDDPSSLSVVAKSKQISKPRAKVDDVSLIAPLPPVSFRINARPPPDHVYYFAYGENMNKNRVSLYIGRQEVQRLWGLLFGFQIKFNKKGSDTAAGVFANIESNPENSVEGCVYLITKAELKQLDKYTGCPQFFSHVMFPVWMINSNDPDALGVAQYCIPAVMYIAKDKWTTMDMTLTSEYSVQQCLRGSELLTPRYVQHIAGCARS